MSITFFLENNDRMTGLTVSQPPNFLSGDRMDHSSQDMLPPFPAAAVAGVMNLSGLQLQLTERP